VDQRSSLDAELLGQYLTDLPEPIDAVRFVQGALEHWLSTDKSQPLSVPVISTLLVLQLVRDPSTVKVYVTTAVRSVTVEFEVEEADKGRIIGKGGHTIDALRSLSRSVAGASERNYEIHLIEDRDHS
jgi:predicted RNA-binding protein YlqC (UPF0109 family)